MYPACYSIPAEEIGKNARIPVLIMDDPGEVYYDMAYRMLCLVEENNQAGDSAVFICPVGPVGQYPIFARLVNEHRTSLKNTWIINMDEYLTDDGDWIDESDPLSFHAAMDRALYSRIDPELVMPVDHRVFPDPHNTGGIWELIQRLGKVDMVTGGIALNGHVAFNEPQLELSAEEFAQLPTRVITLTPETRAKDAILNRGGAIDSLPKQAVTVGMKEILSARKLRFSMMHNMQRAVIRKACYGEVTAACPITLAQNHPDAMLLVTRNVVEKPF